MMVGAVFCFLWLAQCLEQCQACSRYSLSSAGGSEKEHTLCRSREEHTGSGDHKPSIFEEE